MAFDDYDEVIERARDVEREQVVVAQSAEVGAGAEFAPGVGDVGEDRVEERGVGDGRDLGKERPLAGEVPAVLMGHSLGGYLSLRYTLARLSPVSRSSRPPA